jgi:hypothetical protein
MMILIQQIETRWTKRSRGAPGSTPRNAVPDAARLPAERISAYGAVVAYHFVGYGERNDFEQPGESLRLYKDFENAGEEFYMAPFGHNRAVTSKPRPSLARTTLQGWTELGEVLFRLEADLLKANCNPANQGEPRRRPPISFELATGQWGQAIRNARYTVGFDALWMYGKTVLNIGLFDSLADDLYLETSPSLSQQQMAQLW